METGTERRDGEDGWNRTRGENERRDKVNEAIQRGHSSIEHENGTCHEFGYESRKRDQGLR